MPWTTEGRRRSHDGRREKAKARAAQVLELKAAGKSVPEIARLVGASEWTVLRDLERAGR